MSQHYDPFKKDAPNPKKADPFLKEDGLEEERAPEDLVEENISQEGTPQEEVKDGPNQGIFPEDRGTYRQDPTPLPLRRDRVSPFISGGFWIRLVAFLIDTLVASSFASIFSSPILALIGRPEGWVSPAIHGFFYFLYFILATKYTNGQSIGKIITGLRVIHKKEEELSWTTVIIRELFCRFIQNAFPLLYLIAAFTPHKQGLGDMACDTYVVKEALYAVEKDNPNLFYQYI